MLGDSQLNVYVLDTHLSPRHRERIQAQVQTALRSLPGWTYALLKQRIDEIGASSLPLIVEARPPGDSGTRFLSLGEIEGRPAARLTPRLTETGVDWGHDLPTLLAKAAAHLAAPPGSDDGFWQRWRQSVEADALREGASSAAEEWRGASDRDLFIEMFAAYALKPDHARWRRLPAVHAFFERWLSQFIPDQR